MSITGQFQDFLGIERKPKPKPNYQLTALGRQKVEEAKVSGSELRILEAIETSSPCNLLEIAREARMSPEKAKVVMRHLLEYQWVMPMTSGG